MKLTDYQLILASGSPRRRELMQACGLRFEVADRYAVEEVYPAAMPPDEVPLYLARLKSDGYPKSLSQSEILITADTIVLLDGKILGKPRDLTEARAMLRSLSGHTHRVITGVVLRGGLRQIAATTPALHRAASGQGLCSDLPTAREAFSCTTEVTFAPLTDAQIDHYVETFRPLDKAGAYAIQEWIGAVGVISIAGSYNNVVGLPTAQLCEKLQKFIR